ncbi:MAG: DUF3368 domain-containing protein [Thermomicrobiales bacterium]|nr:DUF3368 domain-containing protein [Thermomicrobiales bacterium]
MALTFSFSMIFRPAMLPIRYDRPVIGALGLLVRAKRQHLISEVAPVMAEMIAAGHYASQELQTIILQKAGEA